MKRAANVVEWVTNPEFLGLDHSLWPAQRNALIDMFQDECWPCTEREAKRWEGNLVDLPSVLFNNGVCSSCGGTKIRVHPTRIRECVGAWGQRTGKGWTTIVAATYQLHKALTRGNLAHYYGLASPITFDFTFVDPSKKYLWQPFLQMWERSPWRQMAESTFSKQTTDDDIYYPMQGVRVRVVESEENCRGGIGLFGAIDEYDWVKSQRIDAPKVREVLLISFTTVNTRLKIIMEPDPLDPKLVLFSSPNWDSKDLAILCRRKQYWRTVSHHSTWNVNPEISKADLLAECGGATDRFRRDFAAELPTLRRS